MFSLEHMRRNAENRSELPVGTMTLGSWDTSSTGEELSARRLGTEHSNETYNNETQNQCTRMHTHTSTVWVRVSTGRGPHTIAS